MFCPRKNIEGKALEELKTNPQIIGGYSEKFKMEFFSFKELIIK